MAVFIDPQKQQQQQQQIYDLLFSPIDNKPGGIMYKSKAATAVHGLFVLTKERDSEIHMSIPYSRLQRLRLSQR